MPERPVSAAATVLGTHPSVARGRYRVGMILDNAFIAAARNEPFSIEYRESIYTFRATNAVRYLGPATSHADLELIDADGNVVGYITPYTDREHGAVQARFLDVGTPRLVRTIEDAVREIVT